jgi:hypothetical protein
MSAHLNLQGSEFTAKAIDFTDTEPEFVSLEIYADGNWVTCYLKDVKSAERIVEAAPNARNMLQSYEFGKQIAAFFNEGEDPYYS